MNKINKAELFLKIKFDIDNPKEQISNALQNLYDGGHRECDKVFEEFVKRCAICSCYVQEEDYGRNRVELFLNSFLQDKEINYDKEK